MSPMEIENIQTLHAHVMRTKAAEKGPWRRQCGCLKTSEKLKELLKCFPSPPPPSPANEDQILEHPSKPFDVNCVTMKSMYPFAGDNHSKCISAHCTHNRTNERPTPPRLLELEELVKREELLEDQLLKKSIKRVLVKTYNLQTRKTPAPAVAQGRSDTTTLAGHPASRQSIRQRSWNVIMDLVQLIQLSVTATALALYYLIYCYMQLVYYTLRSALYFHNADGPMKVTIGVVTITSVIVGFNLLLRMERLIGLIGV